MKKGIQYWLLISSILTFLLMGGVMVLSKAEASEQKIAVKVKKILNNGNIELANGQVVTLAGINKNSYNDQTLKYMEKLIKNKYVLFVPDTLRNGNIGYLYLMEGDPTLLPDNLQPGSGPDKGGFLNVKRGWNKIIKILSPNFNVVLIKAGYAKADRESTYQYKEIFIEYEEAVKQQKNNGVNSP